jgi:alpha-L-rhamnosidase
MEVCRRATGRTIRLFRGFAFPLLLMLNLGAARAQRSSTAPVDLTTGSRKNPIGVETEEVRFAWTLEASVRTNRSLLQTAYRVVVASSAKSVAMHRGNIWDSGRIAANTFWDRPYGGPALSSHQTYYWQVQVWDGDSRVGSWSSVARFTTGLLREDDWTAKWIAAKRDADWSAGSNASLPVFRSDVRMHGAVQQALLFVTGLGQYELRLNGWKVTATVLNPAWMNYRKTVPYDTYDVTSHLRSGTNTLAVLLGNGMYNVEDVRGRYTKFSGSFGQPKCRAQMEVLYRDGHAERFVSDGSWKTHSGPITFSSIYGGEDEDARALSAQWDRPGYRAKGWQLASEVEGPGGRMVSGTSPPMVIAATYKPRSVKSLGPGVTVYDLGENMSGWPDIVVRGDAGSSITLLPGELLGKDGAVSQRSTNAFPDRAVLFRYTMCGGRNERWHPRFAYHSFRYVQVTVAPARPGGRLPQVLHFAGDFVHARVATIGEFHSSEELFNRIHHLIDRAVLSNLASVVTDCPSREKLGWLEQTYLNAGTLMWNYDVSGLYEKMGVDIEGAQLEDGLVPSIAPEFVKFVDEEGKNTPFRDSPEWGSAVILSPWAMYQFTGDKRSLMFSYGAMQRYAAYLESRADRGILDYGLGDWYDIGPKTPGPSQLTSKAVTATGVYYEDLSVLARVAEVLGKNGDAEEYERKAAEVRNRFNASFFHPATDQYDRGSQTANAIPLALGLVPVEHRAAVLEHLVADIKAHGDHADCGDVGFHYVVRALTDMGRSDVLARMFSRTDSPSYGYQLARGATTLTEAWDASPESSQNHFMLGHGEEWFYRGLVGLRLNMSNGQENAITMWPSFLEGVDGASASYRSVMGLISEGWQRTETGGTVDVSVPVGAQAHLRLPASLFWKEHGVPPEESEGVLNVEATSAGLNLTLGSGDYHFVGSQVSSDSANVYPEDGYIGLASQ